MARKSCPVGKVRKGNVCVTKRKSKAQWVATILTNDEYSSDKQMIRHFQKEGSMSLKKAKCYVKQRDKALLNPLQFKLKKCK